jgi:putative drug exporter of the RND superfamily
MSVFGAIARFDVRFRWVILIIWVVAAPVAARTLPSLASVTQTSNAQFLPAGAPSAAADKLAAPFEGSSPASSAILVAYRPGRPLTAADQGAVAGLEHAIAALPGVTAVHDQGLSPDGRAAEALVATTASVTSNSSAAKAIVGRIRGTFTTVAAPPGLKLYLTGQLAQNVDSSNSTRPGTVELFSLLFIIVLLIIVFRSLLAPLVTLLPAALSLVIAGPLIAEAAKGGLFQVSMLTQLLLIVLLLGAGTDYGLFLVFRTREEAGNGDPRQAVVRALAPVGQTITFSALTVAAALIALLLASFGIYYGIGPSLALGLGVLLLASLTLTPALLAIFGTATFWPSRPGPASQGGGWWGRLAQAVVRRPGAALAAGVVLFGALAAGLVGYQPSGFMPAPPAGTNSAAGAAVLAANFPKATAGAETLLLRFPAPVWDDPGAPARARRLLAASPIFAQVRGPFQQSGAVSIADLKALHAKLGPPAALSASPPPGTAVPTSLYAAYRNLARFISPDGRTVQYYATFAAGPPGSTGAIDAIPAARTALDHVAAETGARASGVAGTDAASYDINHYSTQSLLVVIPVVLAIILILLAILLQSLVAPWYLVITVGLTYLAALGFAMIAFVHIGGDNGIIFLLPLLLFVFSMALGEDYNILVMNRIREETGRRSSFREALTHAIGITGGTITSAGLILAGTFVILGIAGRSNPEVEEVGFSIAFGILLDTFFVRTLLVPSIATLLGRRNWWPSRLSRPALREATGPSRSADKTAGSGRNAVKHDAT